MSGQLDPALIRPRRPQTIGVTLLRVGLEDSLGTERPQRFPQTFAGHHGGRSPMHSLGGAVQSSSAHRMLTLKSSRSGTSSLPQRRWVHRFAREARQAPRRVTNAQTCAQLPVGRFEPGGAKRCARYPLTGWSHVPAPASPAGGRSGRADEHAEAEVRLRRAEQLLRLWAPQLKHDR